MFLDYVISYNYGLWMSVDVSFVQVFISFMLSFIVLSVGISIMTVIAQSIGTNWYKFTI